MTETNRAAILRSITRTHLSVRRSAAFGPSSVLLLGRLSCTLLLLWLLLSGGGDGAVHASFVPLPAVYDPYRSVSHTPLLPVVGTDLSDPGAASRWIITAIPKGGRIRPPASLLLLPRRQRAETIQPQRFDSSSCALRMESLWNKSKDKFRSVRRPATTNTGAKDPIRVPADTSAFNTTTTTTTTTLSTRESRLFTNPTVSRSLRRSFRGLVVACWALLLRCGVAHAAEVQIQLIRTFGQADIVSSRREFWHPPWHSPPPPPIHPLVPTIQTTVQTWIHMWQSAVSSSLTCLGQSLRAALGSVLSWISSSRTLFPSHWPWSGTHTTSPMVAHLSSFFTAVFVTHRRRILWTVLAVVTVRAVLEQEQTRRRLAADATSEWGRYARHPAARGRAMMSGLGGRLLPLMVYMKLVSRRDTPRRDRLQRRAGRVLANQLLQLGPLYIKMGQILSCREKLLPSQWKDALERLQDQVPSQSGAKAQQLAYSVWPGGATAFHETFADMNWTPIAAASLGQVHTAVLRESGAAVALKLQRPFLREIYDRDFALLTKIAAIVDRYFSSTAGSVGGVEQSWSEIFADAEEILYREIDYRAEASNAVRWYSAFGLTAGGRPAAQTRAQSRDGKPLPSAASWLRTPYVYEELSTEQVLVMEHVPSIKITATAKLDAANVTAADREYLADCLGRSYLRQFCCNQFFSTDPHAGNLGVELLNMKSSVPAERVRLVYYDFGQAAELQPNQADGILEIIEAIVDMDVDRSIKSFQKMGVLKEGADLAVVRAKVADNYRTGKVKANRKKLRKRGYKFKVETPAISNGTSNTTTTLSRSSDAAVMQYFTLPAEYAFVARALSQMDGVGKSLDPEFDFVSAAAPWIVEIKGTGLYVKDEALKWITSVQEKIGLSIPARKGETREFYPQGGRESLLPTVAALALVFLVSATRAITGVEKNDC